MSKRHVKNDIEVRVINVGGIETQVTFREVVHPNPDSGIFVRPYGKVTDKLTQRAIEGAEIRMYDADSSRDHHFPSGFAPQDHANAIQYSDRNGMYVYWFSPNTNYYLVVTKKGYEPYISPLLSTAAAIVKHDVMLKAAYPVKLPFAK
ncbi:carboxypeptidase regulatory-like domain-containing protein [Paenibacillus selenitireducens]|uniref:carboxypeptidase regulatory-like domain-containing protein n=1 Tax=Paenibacillus selenitireducens TaxID=1324314 RepID=UPI00117CCB88|nr:carboxypeptidase regulatory-like domain-containing protein [Paenibacillus selenitireducens]